MVVGGNLLDGSQNANLIQSIFLFFFCQALNFDLFQSILDVVTLAGDLVNLAVGASAYYQNRSQITLGLISHDKKDVEVPTDLLVYMEISNARHLFSRWLLWACMGSLVLSSHWSCNWISAGCCSVLICRLLLLRRLIASLRQSSSLVIA